MQENGVYNVKRGKSWFKVWVRPEQKKTIRTKNIVQKFMRLGALVVDTDSGMASVSKVEILSERTKSFSNKNHSNRAAEALSQQTLINDRQILSRESDIGKGKYVRCSF